jgi:hypothetical protein
MSRVSSLQVKVTTAGGNGAAVGSETTIPLNGLLLDFYIDYAATCPATTDVTISDAVFGTILAKSNSATKDWYMPAKQQCDPGGADNGMYGNIPLNGPLTIEVAQANALTDCVVVTIRFLEG